MSLEWQDACGVIQAIKSGQFSAEEITKEVLERARTVGTNLNCYTEIFDQKALEGAHLVDTKLKFDTDPGPLAGVPFAVKNLFDVGGVVTLAGSRINQDNTPAKEDGTAIRSFRKAGGILVGTLNMDEYAYGLTTENTHYGPARNPHDLSRTAGGSSGGSAAAVAGGCVPIAFGTDTNGSVRVPASLCGLFGLKPTFGRVSRAGTALFVPSLDHVGFLTRSVRDAAIAFDLLNGHDPEDAVSCKRPPEAVSALLDQGLDGLRIGRAVGYFEEEATDEALEAVQSVAQALCSKTDCFVQEAKVARHAAMIISAVEGSAQHLGNLQKRPADFDPMTRDRFIAGALISGEAYVRAQMFRHVYRKIMQELFERVDILVAPATPMVAPKIGQELIEINNNPFPSRSHLGRFTQPISFVGLPVVVVPIRTSIGLPIGVQLIGAPYTERNLLRAARFLEAHGVVEVFRPLL
jgi:AtzE family amidohydrolase